MKPTRKESPQQKLKNGVTAILKCQPYDPGTTDKWHWVHVSPTFGPVNISTPRSHKGIAIFIYLPASMAQDPRFQSAIDWNRPNASGAWHIFPSRTKADHLPGCTTIISTPRSDDGLVQDALEELKRRLSLLEASPEAAPSQETCPHCKQPIPLA